MDKHMKAPFSEEEAKEKYYTYKELADRDKALM